MTKKMLVFAILVSLAALSLGFPMAIVRAADGGPIKVLIGYSKTPGPAEHSAIQRLGGTVGRTYRTFPIVEATVPLQAIDGLRHNANVTFVEREMTRTFGPLPMARGGHGSAAPVAEFLPWGVNRIDAEYAWPSYTAAGVNVAVLDTGVNTNHPDLVANIAGGFSAVGGTYKDNYGHGTFVSGIIAAVNNTVGVIGVGPQIRLWAVKAAKGGLLFDSDILEGIDWINGTHTDADPNNDIQVINMSFGGGYSEAEDLALQASYNLGILPVAAAGNESAASPSYPAALPQVVAVSATDRSDGFASFSNYGSKIELAAPGVDVESTTKDGGYGTGSGTSFSSPHVVGVAALAVAAGKVNGLSGAARADALRLHLRSTAEDLGANGKDNYFGYGLVDAEKATLGTTNGDDLTNKPAP